MNEYISREAVEQVLCGIANGLSVRETEALKTKDVKALYKIKGAKEILNAVDNDLCFIPAADVQPLSAVAEHIKNRLYETALNTQNEEASKTIEAMAERIDFWINELKDGDTECQ
jgi:hypothetical protein